MSRLKRNLEKSAVACEIEICPATCWLFGEEFEELAVGASGREANLTGTALWVVGVAMVSPGLIGMKIQ